MRGTIAKRARIVEGHFQRLGSAMRVANFAPTSCGPPRNDEGMGETMETLLHGLQGDRAQQRMTHSLASLPIGMGSWTAVCVSANALSFLGVLGRRNPHDRPPPPCGFPCDCRSTDMRGRPGMSGCSAAASRCDHHRRNFRAA